MSIDGARRARHHQATALRLLATGAVSPLEVLRKPPKALANVDLYVVLLRCPSIGRDRARIICERSRVWPHLTLSEMTPQERQAVIDHLPVRV